MAALRDLFRRFRTFLFGEGVPSIESAESSDWCLVGNIVDAHAYGEAQEIRHGSKRSTPAQRFTPCRRGGVTTTRKSW